MGMSELRADLVKLATDNPDRLLAVGSYVAGCPITTLAGDDPVPVSAVAKRYGVSEDAVEQIAICWDEVADDRPRAIGSRSSAYAPAELLLDVLARLDRIN